MTNLMPTSYASTPLPIDTPAPVVDPAPAPMIAYGHAPTITGDTPLACAHDILEKVATHFEKYIATLDPSHYTTEGMRAAINRFADSDAGHAIDTALGMAVAIRDNAITGAARERQALAPLGDTAEELRNTRYWERTRRILDTKKDIGAMTPAITQLIDDANPSELGVLIDELKPYLQGRGIAATALVEQRLRTRAPKYVDAVRRIPLAEKALQTTQYNAQALRNQMRNTAHPAAWRRPQFVDGRKFDPAR